MAGLSAPQRFAQDDGILLMERRSSGRFSSGMTERKATAIAKT
jgi:hypothetical protein